MRLVRHAGHIYMKPSPPLPQDYRIFVGAFPTGELAERLQQVRLAYDRKTALITPPHVTLAGTYWRSGPPTPENEAQAVAGLQTLRGQVAPFDLILGGIHTFPPASKPIIYLGVERSPQLLAVRQALLGALGSDKHRRFEPHLTLAMRLSAAPAASMLANLRPGEWDRERFTAPIHELRLMQRGPHDPAWRCIFVLELI